MNTNENIGNAFEVVVRTYENIFKLLAELDRVGDKEGYSSITPKFLRWKSDKDYGGWLILSFIKLYQRKEAPTSDKCADLKTDYIYGVDIKLEDKPEIILSRYHYNVVDWDDIPSVSDHWVFYGPIRYKDEFKFSTMNIGGQELTKSTPKDTNVSNSYRGLKEVIFKKIDLTEIKSSNIKEEIFDELNIMSNMKGNSQPLH